MDVPCGETATSGAAAVDPESSVRPDLSLTSQCGPLRRFRPEIGAEDCKKRAKPREWVPNGKKGRFRGRHKGISEKERQRRSARKKEREKGMKSPPGELRAEALSLPPTQVSPLLALPNEMLILVLSYVSYRDLLLLRTLCRSLYRIGTDAVLLSSLGFTEGCKGRRYVPPECKLEVLELFRGLSRSRVGAQAVPAYRMVGADYSTARDSKSAPPGKASNFLLLKSVSNMLHKGSAGICRLSAGKRSKSEDSPLKRRRRRKSGGSLLLSPSEPKREHVTIFACGPPAVGVSSLISRYLWRKFSHKSEPTIYERHQFEVYIDDTWVDVDLLETQGHPQYAELRKSAMAEANGFLLAFSCCSSHSLHTLKTDIIPYLARGRRNSKRAIPMVLVSCQEDLHAAREVTYEEGTALAAELAVPYFETSAKFAINIALAFRTIIKMALLDQAQSSAGQRSVRRSASTPSG